MNAEMRAKIYWFLSDFCLNAPLRGRLCDLKTHLEAVAEQSDDEWISILLEEINNALKDELKFNQLGLDYMDLFGGLKKGKGIQPPFESLWQNKVETPELLGEIAEAYRLAGLSELPDTDAPPDQLGAELRFVSVLCQQQALTDDKEEQKNIQLQQHHFLKQHLMYWLPDYIDQAVHQAETQYYQTVLALLANSIEQDIATLTDQLELVEF